MSTSRKLIRIAVAVMLMLTATPMVVFGYTWSNVIPSNGINNVNCSPLNCSAIISWQPQETALPNGTILAAPSGYTGSTSYNFAYNVGSGQAVFTGSMPGQSAQVSFNPALGANTPVTLTFTASVQSSGGTTTSTTSTSFTSQ